MKPLALCKWAGLACVLVIVGWITWKSLKEKSHPSQQVSGVPRPPKETTAAAKLIKEKSEAMASNLKKLAEKKAPENMTLKVVSEETGQPLEGVEIKLYGYSSARRIQGAPYSLDAMGSVVLPVPPGDLQIYQIFVSKPGYAPKKLTWSGREGQTVPEKYVCKLEKGQRIGGVVKTSEGEPQSGVAISLRAQVSDAPGEIENSGLNGLTGSKTVTDEKGRWFMDVIPKKRVRYHLEITHSNYPPLSFSTDSHGLDRNPGSKTSFEDLLREEGVFILTEGLRLKTRVVDQKNQPIAGITVTVGQQSAVTDGQGQLNFAIGNEQWRNAAFVGDGFAPQLMSLEKGVSSIPATVVMEPSTPLTVKVQDPQGRPIPGVAFYLERVGQNFGGLPGLNVRGNTDQEGRWTWKDASTKLYFSFSVLKVGYIGLRDQALRPGETEIVLTLHPEIQVSGSVVDAETGKPIPRFKVIRVQKNRRSSSDEQAGTDGKYQITMNEYGSPFLLRVQAPGYISQDSNPFGVELKAITIDFQLKKAIAFSGLILEPAGKPAAKAEIVLLGEDRVEVGRGTFGSGYFEAKKIYTTDQGGFEIFPEKVDQTILVIHEKGFLQTTYAASKTLKELKLQPFGRIEGKVERGQEEGPISVCLLTEHVLGDKLQISLDAFSAIIDADNHFTLDQVPPGQWRVAVWPKGGTGAFRGLTPVKVAPGMTNQVAIKL